MPRISGYDNWKTATPSYGDYQDEERVCPLCGESFDGEYIFEVADYSECLDCLCEDPEIKQELLEGE